MNQAGAREAAAARSIIYCALQHGLASTEHNARQGDHGLLSPVING